MNFVPASSNNVILNDYLGKVLALEYRGETVVESVIDGVPTKSPAVRARILAILESDGVGVDLGETLVFPKPIRETLISNKGNAVIGKLVKKDHSTKKDWHYYNLEEISPTWYAEAVRRFEAAEAPADEENSGDDDAAEVAPF